MAKRGKRKSSGGGKGRKGGFVRDSIGRFAKTAGEAIGKAAKAAMDEASTELAAVARESAQRAVREAEATFREAAKNWKEAKKSSEIDDDDFDDAERGYKAAIKLRAKAKSNPALKGK